jgi:hypothetical protein
MILLVNTSDVLQIVSTSTANLDVVAGYADHASGTITPGRSLTTIATATTTTIVAAPGSSTQRTVRFLTIRNRHATTAQTVTLQLYNGSTAYEIYKVTLAAGETLVYDEAAGFNYISAIGKPMSAETGGGSVAAVNALNLSVLASDVVNNNATPNTIADVTGLSFAVTAGETYWFKFIIHYLAAATTTGSRWTINGPGSPTFLSYVNEWVLSAAGTSGTDAITQNPGAAYDSPTASNATSASAAATAGNLATIEGIIKPSANGTVIARFASEVASSAITAKAGSLVQWVRTL